MRGRYAPALAADVKTDYLMVAGLGLVVEQHAAYTLWAKVEAAAGRPLAPSAPAGDLRAQKNRAELFRAHTLRSALKHWPRDGGKLQSFVENYPVPALLAVPSQHVDMGERKAWVDAYRSRVLWALCNVAGMAFHIMSFDSTVTLATLNDRLWLDAFAQFDAAGDLNSLLLFAEDGNAIRSETGGWRAAPQESLDDLLRREKAGTDLRDAFASLLLLRPAAAEWLRELAPHVVDSFNITTFQNGGQGVSAHGFGRFRLEAHLESGIYTSPRAYAKTLYVKEPWSSPQMAQYDGMPGLAWVYRPQLASYAADASPAEQAVQLEAALQRAVKTSLGGKPPTRVFYDVGTGDAAAQRRVMLLNCLKTVLPAFDLLDIKSSYHLTERLGDLGAAGVFAGVALASMAAWETGGTALVINLLRDNGATVMAVRPSEAVYRQQFGKRPYEAS